MSPPAGLAHAKLGLYVRGFCLDALVLPPVFPAQGSRVLRASFPQVLPAASSITFELILFLASR